MSRNALLIHSIPKELPVFRNDQANIKSTTNPLVSAIRIPDAGIIRVAALILVIPRQLHWWLTIVKLCRVNVPRRLKYVWHRLQFV